MYPFIWCVVYDTLHPVCILSFIRHPILSFIFGPILPSVLSYLRYYLTADSRTSPVPAILHFFILFYYFIISMFERFMKCIVSFSYCVSFTIQYLCTPIPHSSRIHPAFIPHSSRIHPAPHPSIYPGVYPVYVRHPIPSFIFGLILPSVLSYR